MVIFQARQQPSSSFHVKKQYKKDEVFPSKIHSIHNMKPCFWLSYTRYTVMSMYLEKYSSRLCERAPHSSINNRMVIV